MLVNHELDEHALSESIDGREDTPHLSIAEQFDRFVMVECCVRSKQPIMSSARTEGPSEMFEDGI